MLSDDLYEAGKAIRDQQTNWPQFYDGMTPELDALRAHIVVIQMRLDAGLPQEWLEKNPVYAAAKAGDVSLYDRFMDGDDSVLAEFRAELAKVYGARP